MKTEIPTLQQIYRQHCELQLDEHQTVQQARQKFPKTWQQIYSLMNQTIKQQGTAK